MENLRIPVDLTSAKAITFKLEQEFEQLEILSLTVSASDVYAQMTSDFGVVVGRVNVNGGFGVQNAKISVFVPVSADDKMRADIIQLYPFTSPLDKLTNGVRYNIFPRIKQPNFSHQPIGIFPDVTDLTYYPTYLEIYEKYYKFTTTTNDSGDYMIFGVPLGSQFVHMDFDLFDTKSFYITANDLVTEIQTSTAISTQLSAELTKALNPNFELTTGGTYNVKVNADIDSMPNIFSDNKMVNVVPLWGDSSIHQIGINRCDFELSYQYVPTAILFGSFTNMSYWAARINLNYQTEENDDIFSISQQDAARDLKVIVYKHLNNQQVERYGIYSAVPSGDNSTLGVFILSLPMYEDYYITDEFGQLVPSTTGNGVPTKGHYVFEFFDDSESIYGNGRRSEEGWGKTGDTFEINYSDNLTAGIRVPADSTGHRFLSGWKTLGYDDTTLFEYDILKGSPRFYTVQTRFRTHNPDDIRLEGGVISYLPRIDANSTYNIPIDRLNPPDLPILRGMLFSPRFLIVDGMLTANPSSDLLYANEMTWIPWYPSTDTANYQTRVWDWVYGVGVRHLEGSNWCETHTNLYSDFIGFRWNLTKTWFFGDNPWDGDNVPVANYYAQLLAQKPDATNRQINAVHNRFNLAVSPNFTAGLFVSSVNYGSAKVLFETSVVDITDELPNLISDGVYSSFGFTDTDNTENRYHGHYYLFGLWAKWQNALNTIKERYFNG